MNQMSHESTFSEPEEELFTENPEQSFMESASSIETDWTNFTSEQREPQQ